ncbi:hypothetical protein VM98_18295 [Streptomyces rubellomurinus subsp. indigoferus]|nr:hypothetical protein VM98_18295 [Streptomyces rubellomurinus subsp. indigoferus]
MRIALHTRVRAERIEEYEAAHRAVPDELTAAVRAAGVSSWTIRRSDCELFAGVVDWTDLTAPDVVDRIAALSELPGGGRLVGIRHQVQEEPDPNWLLRPEGGGALSGAGCAAR